MRSSRTAPCLLLVAITACSTEFTPQTCSVDGDCGSGLVCEQRGQQTACVAAKDAPLVIGQSAPVSGTNQALGTGMKLGIELAFKEKNAAGGIRGRELRLEFRDDAYQPDLAETATRNLVDAQISPTDVPKCPSTAASLASSAPVSMTALTRGPKAVLAMLGNVGTPTMLRAAPVAIETGTVFFGAFTGATTLLRETATGAPGPCWRYIFNVRASYTQEAQATVEYFKKKGVTGYKNLVSFDQNDSFGQSGYDGLVTAYKNTIGPFPGSVPDPNNPIFRQRYTRNDDSSVPATVVATQAYLTQLLAEQAGTVVVGVMMTDTYGAGAEYIQGLKQWQFDGGSPANKATRLKLNFSNVSFVGANALSDRLKSLGAVPNAGGETFTDNVVISQVVPNYQSDSSEVVTKYNALIAENRSTPSFTSLEGYVAARVFIAGLEAHQGPFTSAALVDTFESLRDLGLGVGATSGFSTKNHQYSSSVWGTILQRDGTFRNLYFWSAGTPIQFFE